DAGRYLLVASQGGHAQHPAGYLHLVEQPEVDLQVGAERFKARASTATGDERARLWSIMDKIWPSYNEYQESTDREIPVVVLERV
ncbi:MAG: nitroreductase/quinone reductase family protein, partial [Gammaproteobacteria bacterium]|nr:nitroreductase/quinone reductase family protein [Gammaproteobacteria bacterium]